MVRLADVLAARDRHSEDLPKLRRRAAELDDFDLSLSFKIQDRAPAGVKFPTIKSAQAYVDDVFASAWWRARYERPFSARVLDRGTAQRLDPDKSGSWARPMWDPVEAGGLIWLHPTQGRHESVLLHELAHLGAPEPDHGIHPHGAEWRRVFIDLARERMSVDLTMGRIVVRGGFETATIVEPDELATWDQVTNWARVDFTSDAGIEADPRRFLHAVARTEQLLELELT